MRPVSGDRTASSPRSRIGGLLLSLSGVLILLGIITAEAEYPPRLDQISYLGATARHRHAAIRPYLRWDDDDHGRDAGGGGLLPA